MKAALAALVAGIAFLSGIASAASFEPVRAMWVWRTTDLFIDNERERFLDVVEATALTDVYLYLRTGDYAEHEAQLQSLLEALAQSDVRAWGMEGWRGYFSDIEGPAELYRAADALVAFNERSDNRFAGFHSDLEPHDGQEDGEPLFHNGVSQQDLTQEQLAERDALMSEWLTMHEVLLEKMQAAGLQYGAALPSWVDDYYGASIRATFRGERRDLIDHLSRLVPKYVIMSYNTDPDRTYGRIEGEMAHAEALGRRQMVFSVETHPGAGVNVSYADTPPKNRRAVVLADLAALEARALAGFPRAYLGWAIHDYEGWVRLPP
jgi:hypothetical protein